MLMWNIFLEKPFESLSSTFLAPCVLRVEVLVLLVLGVADLGLQRVASLLGVA